MKCQSCECKVSSDFQYALKSNCCPKCGDIIMDKDIQSLLLKMNQVMAIEGNDIGDLAQWFIKSYLPQILPQSDSEVDKKDTITVAPADDEIEFAKPLKTKAAQRHAHLPENGRQPKKVSPFAQRAGLTEEVLNNNSSKFGDLVRDIQGDSSWSDTGEDISYEPYDPDDATGNILNEDGQFNISELQKLQRLERVSSGGGMFKRA